MSATKSDFLIAIDAGHGTNGDPGAVGPTGLQEADVNSQLGQFLENEMKNAGFRVFRTDRTLLSSARAFAAGQAGCDLLVSLHCNAAGSTAKGIETWFPHGNEEGEKLARSLQQNLVLNTVAVDRGVKDDGNWRPAGLEDYTGGMGVLREFPGPACLVELLFISNPDEEKKLASNTFLLLAAQAIACGIASYLGQPPVQPPAPTLFPDIPADLWSGKARAMALRLLVLGVISGYEDGTFRPAQAITRMEAATLVYKALVVLGKVAEV